MAKIETWEKIDDFREYIQQKIAISEASISFLDIKKNSIQQAPERDPDFIILKDRTYELLKRYVDLIQSQDNLCKSFDDRILDLLANEGNLSSFRPIISQIKRNVKDLVYTPHHTHLSLREITKQKLSVYCYLRNLPTYDKGLYYLIEKALSVMTIKNLKRELEEVML